MPIKVCVGGTFNVIHEGHMALLKMAFREGDEVFIGLTSDKMARKGRSCQVLEYRKRLANLIDALKRISAGKPFHVFKIEDEFGPAASGDFDVIVVSEETEPNARRINSAREKSGLRPLRVVAIPMVKDSSGNRISSTAIITAGDKS